MTKKQTGREQEMGEEELRSVTGGATTVTIKSENGTTKTYEVTEKGLKQLEAAETFLNAQGYIKPIQK